MKLYVAGPMSGYADFNYAAFEVARQSLKDAGYEVLCPTDSEEHNDTGKPQTWDWYMRHAIGMVIEAEGLAVLPDWQTSRGARLEVEIGLGLAIPVLPLHAWLAKSGDSHE